MPGDLEPERAAAGRGVELEIVRLAYGNSHAGSALRSEDNTVMAVRLRAILVGLLWSLLACGCSLWRHDTLQRAVAMGRPAILAGVASWALNVIDAQHVHGTLRVPLNPDLRSRVEAVLRRGHRRILLDVSALLVVDAAGIGELIQAFNMTSTEGGVLRIVGTNGRVRRLLEITGLFELLTHGVSPEQDALAARGLWHR